MSFSEWKQCDCVFCMIYLISSCPEHIGLKSHSLFFVDIERENVATVIDTNTCVKCQVNLEDEKLLYTIKDGITKLIDYSKQIGNSHFASFLNESHDTGLSKIHRDCQKDMFETLKTL